MTRQLWQAAVVAALAGVLTPGLALAQPKAKTPEVKYTTFTPASVAPYANVYVQGLVAPPAPVPFTPFVRPDLDRFSPIPNYTVMPSFLDLPPVQFQYLAPMRFDELPRTRFVGLPRIYADTGFASLMDIAVYPSAWGPVVSGEALYAPTATRYRLSSVTPFQP